MARLTDLPEPTRIRLTELECPEFETAPWTQGPPLNRRRVAIVSTAGLYQRGETPFQGGDADFRRLPHDAPADAVLMSHVSVNFDRTGWQRDPEVVLPRAGLDALAAAGEIGAAGANHYSFMGATDPKAMAEQAARVAAQLRAEGSDSAILIPV
ncbi:hypothetical protein ACFOGJ_06860 [Marinibaculum pumilum]|uniref:Selenoprotein B glycine/betaine/sarcosine/D-proline reductase n=1 Tax=Marinibaculum pumilum TaxID=1766165 RepID=A0ABV7KXT9_9PROT